MIQSFIGQGFTRCFSRSENADLFGDFLYQLSIFNNHDEIEWHSFFEDAMSHIIQQYRDLENKLPGSLTIQQICQITLFLDETNVLNRDLEFTQFVTKVMQKVFVE